MLIAAGGGGDAIGSAALARAMALPAPAVIMTYAWDRLLIDPLPGPRSLADFVGLRRLDDDLWEVRPDSRTVPPAGSSLPRLAGHLRDSHLLLLDPSAGAVGMARQVGAAAEVFGADDLLLVDVGGDALTSGDDPGLRSPLADQLAIAGCLRLGMPTRLAVVAPGIDGEIDRATLDARLAGLGVRGDHALEPTHFDGVRDIFTWHPSEASGLLMAASKGHRGSVEVRDAGDQIDLTDDTARGYLLDITRAPSFALAHALTTTTSLVEAGTIVQDLTGINEWQYEQDKAARRIVQAAHRVSLADLHRVDELANGAAQRGSDYLSMRRLAELVGVTDLVGYADLGLVLATHRPDQYALSLYGVRPFSRTYI